jgi:hypothetical protein
VDSVCSGEEPVADCCECGDEPSSSGDMELVFLVVTMNVLTFCLQVYKE